MQGLIDGLPGAGEITRENGVLVKLQLETITESFALLPQEDQALVDLAPYQAAGAALAALEAAQVGKTVTAWTWVQPEEEEDRILDPVTGEVYLSATQEEPIAMELLTGALPRAILATVEGAEETLPLGPWTCEGYPAGGAFTGDYTFVTTLPEGYTLAEGVAALEVKVRFDEPETLAEGPVSSETDLINAINTLQSGGTIQLGESIDIKKGITINKDMTLDLGGHTLTYSGRDGNYKGDPYGVFTLDSGEFTVRNGTLKKEGSQQYLRCFNVNNGTLTIEGVTINGFSCVKGGGAISIKQNGICNMNSGTISGNSAWGKEGGGVYVRGIFNMNGGAISKNNVSSGSGGGVYVYNSGTFTMTGGAISGNQAQSGGGVYVNSNGTFTMTGGTISGNTANCDGGGVYVYGGSFTMESGTISDNTANENGGGVYVYQNGSFNMTGGTVSGNTANAGGGVYMYSGSFTMTGGSITGNSAGADGKGVYMGGTSVSCQLSGGAKIAENTGSGKGNLYINGQNADHRSITKLTTGAHLDIYFSRPEDMRVATGDQESLQYLTLENEGYKFILKNTNELWLKQNRMEIIKSPTAKTDLIYDGTRQVLVDAGQAGEGGTMYYGVSTDGSKPYAYLPDLPQKTNAGTYTVWYYAKGVGDKADSDMQNLNVTIAPKPLTVTGTTVKEKTYDGTVEAEIDKPGQLDGVCRKDANQVTLVQGEGHFENKNAGKQTVIFSGFTLTGDRAKNYTLTQPSSITASIAKKELQGVLTVKDITYGESIKSSVTWSSGWEPVGTEEVAVKLEYEGTDGTVYDRTETAPTNAGTYTAMPFITDSNYSLQMDSVKFTIAPKSVTNPIIQVVPGSTYDGTAQEPEVTVTDEDGRVIPASEYTVSYSNNTKAGVDTAIVTVSDKDGGNYIVSGTEKFSIAKAEAPRLYDVTHEQKYTVTAEQTVSLADIGMPANAGTLTYTKKPVITTSPMTVDWSVDPHGKVTFTITGGQPGNIVILPVTVGSDNYADAEAQIVITLTDRDTPTLEANDITVTYSGEPVSPAQITGTATFGEAEVPGTWSWKDDPAPRNVSDSGKKTVVFTPEDLVNYNPVETEVQLTIAPKNISDAAVTLGDSLTYNGQEQTQSVTSVKVDGLDVEYTVTGDKGTNAGSYKMTFTGTGNFTGTKEAPWSIAKKDITDATVTLEKPIQIYTGQVLTNAVTGVKIDGLTLGKGDYTVSGNKEATDVGTYFLTVTAKDSSNFTGSASATWQIQAATDNKWTTTPTVTGCTYGETPTVTMGAAKFGTAAVEYFTQDGNNNLGTDIPTNAGSYKAVFTVEGTDNYNGLSETVDFTISKKPLTVTAENKTVTYGDVAPDYTVTYEGFVEGENESKLGGPLTFTCEYAPGKDVGSYDITPKGLSSDNYKIDYKTGTLTVGKREIQIQWSGAALTYNGKNQAPVATVANPFGTDVLTLEVTGGAVDAGRHTATIQRIIGDKAGNYTLPPNHSTVFFIDKATPTVTPPSANTLTYNGTAQTLAKDGSTDGGTLVYSLEENGTYSEEVPTGTQAGGYTVWYKVEGNSNYNGTQAQGVVVTIAPRNISDADVTLGADLTYNGEVLTKEVKTVTVEGLNVTYKVTGNTGKDAKDYTMTLRGTGNFTGKTKANWSIAQKSIQGATVSLGDKLIYSGEDQTQNIASVTVSGVTGEVTYKVTGNTGKDATDYTMTLQGTGNFTGETTMDWSIAKKDVTVQDVAVASKVYDGTDNATITDNGHLSANFDGENLTFHVGTAAYDDKNAGADKTVTFTGFSLEGPAAKNYQLTGQPGDITASITPKPVALTVTAKDKTYDGTLTAKLDTVTHSGFVKGDDVQLVNGTPSFVSKDKGEKVRLTFTPFTLTGTDAGNYALTQPTGVTARISPRPVTVSGITAQNKTYDGNTQVTFGYENARLEGNVDGDKLTVTAEGSFEDANVGDKQVYITGLTLGGAEQGNYVLAAQGQQTTATAAITANDRYLDLSGVDLGGDPATAWIDGEKQPINTDGGSHMLLPENAEVLTTNTYGKNADGKDYPTGMKVYRIEEKDTGAVLTEIPELENLLIYAGCSIRLTGTKGIRMITGVNEAARKALISKAGLAGYTLEEYGTVVMRGVGTPTLENSNSHNFAYKKGKADPVFGRAGGTVQYTNVLVGFSLEDCKDELTMRPYIILKDIATGETVTFYGGCVSRSIGYIAKQNENTYQPGTAGYKYIHEIIDAVYGKTEQGGETK